jgi:uncharacterized protein involved in outer membrane biogenesis
MKKAAYGFAGLLVLLVGAALIVPSVIDWNAYKPEIAAEVHKATGRTLDIDGPLEFAVLPTPHLKVSNARLSNAPGATAKSMLSLKELEVSVKLVPLMGGSVEIASLALIEPVIELEKMRDGAMNWVFAPARPTTTSAVTPIPAGSDAKPASDKDAFKLDSLRIENGTIVYRDTPAGSIERLEKLTADISAQSLAGPFVFDGGMTVRGIPLTLAARMSKFAEKGAVPFRVNIGTPGTATTIGLAGTVTDIETKPAVAAKIDGKGADLGALIAALSGAPASAPLSQKFSVTGGIRGSAAGVVVNDLAIQLGGSSANGDIKIDLQDGVKADVALRMQSLDLDALLTREAAVPGTSNAAGGKAGKASTPVKTQASAQKFELPEGVEANVSLAIEEVIARKDRLRGIRLAASLKDRRVTLNTLEAGLPGGGQFSASGQMTAPEGALSYGGKMSFRSSSLRALLNWLEVDISSVPADRLRRFNVSADISGDAAQVQIANIASQLDASRMSGGVTVALRERTAFGASINIDQFNADAYMQKPVAAKAKASPKAAAAPSAGKPNTPSKGPLAVLNEFDANLAIRVGSLNYQRTAIQGVRLDGTLVNGVLTLRDASVRSLAGTSAQIKGTVTGLSGVPAFKGTIAAASDDLTGLFRVAGIESSVPPRKLGKMRLSSRTDVSDGKLNINADLQIAEIRAKITGNATGLPAAPAFNIVLDAKHPELARLANLFGDGKPGPAVGRVGLKLSLKGDERAITINADTAIAGGSFRLSGNIATPLNVPKLNIGLELKHPNFVRFVKAFDPGFSPANRRLGALRFAAKLAGTEQNLAITDLSGNIGPTKISGSGSYAAGAVRPDIKLSLISSVIPLSDFLEAPRRASAPGRRSGAGRPGASPRSTVSGQRWSTEPIDTSAFGLANATIDLRAQALLYDTFRVDQPKIIAVLKDKVLDIRQISGTMFDGGFEMKGKVDGRRVPIAATTLKIVKANVGKALFQAAEFDIATGVLTFDMELSAAGKSQAAMIGALNGKGRINVVDGVVKGFDLKRASDDLKNVNQVAGLLGVLGSAMRGGSTNFSSLAGSFTIERGVMRTNDLALVADAGAGDARGYVDLPRWNMDMTADFRLTEHANAPAFRVRAVGPPDNPRRLFDFQALQAWILQQGVGGLIKNLIPGAKQNSGTQQNQQQQQVKPEDILKGLLKGLGR